MSEKIIEDIKTSWLSVARRLQSIASRNKLGYSIIAIHVLTNKDGEAISWTTPSETRIEPSAKNFHQILSIILKEMSFTEQDNEGKVHR